MPLRRAPLRRATIFSVSPIITLTKEFRTEQDPRQAYMEQAVRRSMKPRQNRLARLVDARTGIQEACRSLEVPITQIDTGEVRFRRQFVRLASARALRDEDHAPTAVEMAEEVATRPPLTRLVYRRSIALSMYLTAVVVAQGAPASIGNPGLGRPFATTDPASWATLTGLRRMSARVRRVRLQRALTQLWDRSLVELAPERESRRFDRFSLLSDDGDGRGYRVPGEKEALVVPGNFFLNGWHLVLDPGEIAMLFMVLELSSYHQDSEKPGVGAVDRVRRSAYGITGEVYSSHRELAEFGLLQLHDTVPGRRLGRMPADVEPSDVETFYFTIVPDAFDRPAVETVIESLSAKPARPYLVDE